MDCLRLSGTAGNERGACTYTRIRDSFRYDIPGGVGGAGSLGWTIALPLAMTNVQYEYVRTGTDTGRVTFTFNNNQVYPHPEATATTTPVGAGLGDMFWGGRNDAAVNLVVDILFTDQGGFIGNTTTRIRSGYTYSSTFTDGAVVNREFPFDFDTPDTTYKLISGAALPAGYNPYATMTPTTPSSAVWSTLQDRVIIFSGSDLVNRKINQQAVGGVGPPIPGVTGNPEESGTILVDEDNGVDIIQGVSGTYSYQRTGGDKAKMAIRYNRTVGGSTTTVNLVYDMDFESLDAGLYVDNKGVSGNFRENLFGPN
ncbi:MAG: hypothetical protein Q8Q59_16010 [Luteolibacter sp.]|nr:hypothetical protein [Luteolibacter sp.]